MPSYVIFLYSGTTIYKLQESLLKTALLQFWGFCYYSIYNCLDYSLEYIPEIGILAYNVIHAFIAKVVSFALTEEWYQARVGLKFLNLSSFLSRRFLLIWLLVL